MMALVFFCSFYLASLEIHIKEIRWSKFYTTRTLEVRNCNKFIEKTAYWVQTDLVMCQEMNGQMNQSPLRNQVENCG